MVVQSCGAELDNPMCARSSCHCCTTPSPWRHRAQDEIYPQPHDEQRPVETRRPANELRPYIICEVLPDMAGELYPGIAGETMIIEDELKL
jgi:hypothetical protein